MARKRSIQLILWLFDGLLWLYPPGFRARFALEQHQVFEQVLADGEIPPWKFLLRELVLLPVVLLRCHWTALRGGGWRHLLKVAALLVLFTLPALFVIDQLGIILPVWIGYIVLIGFAGAFLTGAALGFPRWALPYAGLVLSFLLLPATNALMDQIGRRLPRRDYSTLPLLPRLGYSAMWESLSHIPLLLVIFGVLIVLRLLPIHSSRWPKRWQRPRGWSDVSFLLYGAALFSVIIAFDEYSHSAPYALAAAFCLLAGAVGFMRARSQGRAVGSLLRAVTLAFLIISIGQWVIIPLQSWNGWLETHPAQTERWFGALSTLITLGWMWIILLLPAGWRPFIENGAVPTALEGRDQA